MTHEIPDKEFDISLTTDQNLAVSESDLSKIREIARGRGNTNSSGRVIKKTNDIGGLTIKVCVTSDTDELYAVTTELLTFLGSQEVGSLSQYNLTIGIFACNAFCIPFIFDKEMISLAAKAGISMQIYVYPEFDDSE